MSAAIKYVSVINASALEHRPSEVNSTLNSFSVLKFNLPDSDRIEAACAWMMTYQRGTVLGYFRAVERAVTLFAEDRLCLDISGDQRPVVDALYGWDRIIAQYNPAHDALVNAWVLGIPHRDVPHHNKSIGPRMAELIDALNDVCDPGVGRTKATARQKDDLQHAREAVLMDFTENMSLWATMVGNHRRADLHTATKILKGIATSMDLPCYLDGADGALRAVLALIGDDFKAAGLNFVRVVSVANAWKEILDWLSGGWQPGDDIKPKVCRAAATLRPRRSDPAAMLLP